MAFVLGSLSALAFAPIYALPLLWPGLTGLLLLILSAPSRKRAFWESWFWGFGHFLVCSYWIGESFLIEAARFGWMIPFVLGGLASYLALFPALVGYGLRAIHFSKMEWNWILFGCAWTIGEWLRGSLLTGYPWDLMAYVWGFSPATMQSAAFVGPFGLSLLTVLLASAPALAQKRLPSFLGASIVLIAFLLLPSLRMMEVASTSIKLRLVQPNLSQSERVNTAYRHQHLQTLLDLSREAAGESGIKATIWPEAATDFLLERHPEILKAIGEVAPSNGYVLTGAVRAEPLTGRAEKIWNSLEAIDAEGIIRARGDKSHLVPLGEYVPGRNLFPFINKLTPGDLDFSTSEQPATLHLAGLPSFGVLICYEAIFPGRVVNSSDRPLWLLNVTNDGWFGKSIGPYQHFISARFRAVEEGLPLVRVANTGISALIDPYGRIVAKMGIGETGILDVNLPSPSALTLYSRFNAIVIYVIVFIFSIGAFCRFLTIKE